MNKKIFILAGEASGDLHGSALVKKLKNAEPNLEIYGVGGDAMIEAGMRAIFHINELAFLGLTEVIKHLPKIFAIRKTILKFLEEENIKTVLLIDYPGFNLNIAKKLKERGIKVLYYISPQLWAWGSSRAKKMKKRIDKLFVVFPFEVEFFAQYGIEAEFVGHPLIERMDNYEYEPREDFYRENKLDDARPILLLMPGSRKHEVEMILPEMFSAAEKLAEKFNMQIVISASQNIGEEYYRRFSSDDAKIITGKTYELLRYSEFGLIKSGTSTLEAALSGLPFIVLYKTGAITYAAGKKLVKIDSIALANIVAGEKIVEELIQGDANAEKIYATAEKILSDKNRLNEIKAKLGKVKEKLKSENAETDLTKRILEELR